MLDDPSLSKISLFLLNVSIPQHPDDYWSLAECALIFIKMCFLNAFTTNSLTAETGDSGALRVTKFHKPGIAATQ